MTTNTGTVLTFMIGDLYIRLDLPTKITPENAAKSRKRKAPLKSTPKARG